MTGQPQLAARARALQARMTQTCTLIKLGESYWDEDTHTSVQQEIILWAGPCLIRPADTAARQVRLAADQVTVRTFIAWLPMTAAALDGAEYLIWDVPGGPLKLAILDAPLDSWPIGRRVVCQAAASS